MKYTPGCLVALMTVALALPSGASGSAAADHRVHLIKFPTHTSPQEMVPPLNELLRDYAITAPYLVGLVHDSRFSKMRPPTVYAVTDGTLGGTFIALRSAEDPNLLEVSKLHDRKSSGACIVNITRTQVLKKWVSGAQLEEAQRSLLHKELYGLSSW